MKPLGEFIGAWGCSVTSMRLQFNLRLASDPRVEVEELDHVLQWVRDCMRSHLTRWSGGRKGHTQTWEVGVL